MFVQKKNRLQSGNSGDDTKRKTFTVKSIARKAEKIKIVIQQPGEISQIIEIPNTLKAFQEVVGGYIEVINLGNGLIGVIDEEGRIKDKKANIDYYGSDIRGTVVITAADGESFRSLTTSEIQSARTYLMKNSIGG